MPQALPLALAAYKRSGFPEAVTVNCYAERAPTKDGFSLISRAGLEPLATVGAAPARCLFQKQGLFNDAALLLSGASVYTLSASGASAVIGGTAISGMALVDIDAGFDQDGNSIARIANGSALYKVTATAVTLEDFPIVGGQGALSVQYYRGYWVAVDAESGAMYYIVPNQTTWDPLQFAAADYKPDRLKGVRVFGDLLALMGETSTEVWRLTGDAGSPIEPYGGLNFPYGCRALAAAVSCADDLIWVDHECGVRICSGGAAPLISDNGLAEQIRRCSPDDLRASSYTKDGHRFYSLTLGDAATWAYDLTTKQWTRGDSQGYDFWRSHLFCNVSETVLSADALSAQIWRLDPDRRNDGDDTFTVKFRVFVPPHTPLGNVTLDCLLGDAPRTGQGSDSLISMRISRDDAATFGAPRYQSLGKTGHRIIRPRWNACGTAGDLGMILEFACSDPVGRRFSGVLANAP